MPLRRRLASAPVRDVDPVSCFRWSGDGCSHPLGKPHYRDRQEAGRAWDKARRAVWAATFRFTVPGPAAIYDGLTTAGRDVVYRCWHHTGDFPLRYVLQALAEDRAHLAAFEATRGARQIDDYLALVHADLDQVEQTARDLAAVPEGAWRPYPAHLNVSTRYGHSTLPESESSDHDD